MKQIPDLIDKKKKDAFKILDELNIDYDKKTKKKFLFNHKHGTVVKTEPEKDEYINDNEPVKLTTAVNLFFIIIPSIIFLFLIGLIIGDKTHIINIFGKKLSAPVIAADSTDWEKSSLVKVTKDAKTKSKIDYYEYCVVEDDNLDNCKWQKTKTKNASITTTGKHKVVFRAVDQDGNKSKNSNIVDVLVDNNSPIVEKVIIGTREEDSIKVTVNANDTDSGLDKYYYSVDGVNYEEGKKDFTFRGLVPSSEYTVYIKLVDKVGNESIISFKVSTTAAGEKDVKGETHETAKPTETPNENNNNNNNNNNNGNTTNPDNGQGGIIDPNGGNNTPGGNTNPGGNENPNGGNNNPGGNTNPGGGNDPGNDPEPTWDIPIISLSLLPAEINYKDNYNLPSSYSFGNDTGTYACRVDGVLYENTSTILPGDHTVECEIVSAHDKRSSVSKDFKVKLTEGDDLVLDGWIRLNLYYPENSTNWEWRLDKPDSIRTGYDNDSWQPYTGPILVKLEDVSNIYIRYDLNGETKIIAPKGKVLVDIVPDSYSIKDNEQTRVVINYDTNANTKQYRVNGSEWKEYTGPFVVNANSIIEAQATKEEAVYNTNGDYKYTQISTGNDSVYISVLDAPIPTPSSSTPVTPTTGGVYTPSGPGGLPVSSGGSPIRPTSYLAGPTITANPSDTVVDSVEVTITTEYPASSIYYSINNGKYTEYTLPFTIEKNSTIRAYYIRNSDSKKSSTSYLYVNNIKEPNLPYVKISASPSNYLSEDVNQVDVTIACSDCDTLKYSFDGVVYTDYTSPLQITESTTVYAKATNANGETIEDLVIRTKTPAVPKDELSVKISANPSSVSGLIGSTEITIMYDEGLTNRYYKIGYFGTWQEYTGPFTLSENNTIYAYGTGTNSYGEDELFIDFLTTGIASPKIDVSPSTPTSEVIVNITYDKNASVRKYRIGTGELKDYEGPFYVNENATIYAYNENILGQNASATKKIKNIAMEPNYTVLDKGDYYIIKLNYPDVSDPASREYKWKTNGTWKTYDEKGILLIKPNAGINISSAGVKVEDENGNDVIFEDHYYVLDVPTSELSENLFMRWDNEKPGAPTILVVPSDEPTKEVDVYITYPLTIVDKKYKIVKEDGTDSGWLEYTGTFKVDEDNVTIYAKGYNRIEIESKIATAKVTNIDAVKPTITIKGDYEVAPKQKDSLYINAKDDLAIDIVKYAKGEQDEDYFKENGTLINNNANTVITENGVYTFFAKDKVGNTVTKVIEVTNIDNNAPDVVITDKTETFGPTATIEITYGDSTTKQYSIGNNTNYQNYTGELTLNAKDYFNLKNADGSLTIYAKGVDAANNITEVSETIYSIDLDMPATPVITSLIEYPMLTTKGITLKDDLMITYDSRNDTKNYIDAGLGYVEYKGAVNINKGTVKAKSVKLDTGLESLEAVKEINLPENALAMEAYDNKADTEATINANSKGIFTVANDGKTKIIKIKSDATAGAKVVLYGLDGSPLKETDITEANQSVKISESVTKVEIVTTTNALKVYEIEMEKIVEVIEGNSILDILNKKDLEEGYYTFKVADELYPVHLIVLEGDQVIDTDTQFGDAADIATASSYAENMVIVKVKGDLVNNANIGPIYTNYGGPKGFILYVIGKLTNNGTIDNSHGAYAVGQNVYLWKNSITNDYEMIPAIGGAGAATPTARNVSIPGLAGSTAGKRALGGGAAGRQYVDPASGGGSATSYSGGTGGASDTVADPSQYGGRGADGKTGGYTKGIGGAGNPAGSGSNGSGENGTGGLLVIYSNEFENNGSLTAHGYNGRKGQSGDYVFGGGSSGGGSINIFTNQPTNINSLGTVVNTKYSQMLGTTNVAGGTTLAAGGAGTINIGEIREGQYYDLKEAIQQDMDAYAESVTITGESIIDILNNNPNLAPGYHNFRVITNSESVVYGVHLYVLDGNQTITENTQYGDASDCATGATDDKMAKNMVIVRVNGNYTVNENVTVGPYYNATYGGPKGFLLYVTGKLTNNGTIDNSHGAFAYGENVYLWKNSITNDYEMIPAIGGAGAATPTARNVSIPGLAGSTAGKRALGGGAAGRQYVDPASGGGSATSYSGGTGGASDTVADPSQYGGRGADGKTGGYTKGIGGAGNPAGSGSNGSGENGTGGLLVIYSNEFENNGSLTAHGYNGRQGRSGDLVFGGGSSGGGSVNIFTSQPITGIALGMVIADKYNSMLGTTNVAGGTTLAAGGAGTVNIGGIRDGQYYDLTEIIEQDYDVLLDSHKVPLTLVTGDGYLEETTMYVRPYKKITSVNLPIPATDDHTIFVGWYFDEGLTNAVSNNSDYEIRDAFTLYARYNYILQLGNAGLSLDYSGLEKIVKVQKTGKYKIEVWGASGGRALCNNSLCGTPAPGGYASGIIELTENDMLYINVGGAGQNGIYKANATGGYNGGGSATWDNSDDESAGAGGGATDIRYMNNSLAARIMVAGGGGGSSYGKVSGYGGGLSGGDGNGSNAPGATQTSGYSFGFGKNGEGSGSSDGVAGGGGGYYGGTSYNASNGESASGGSGYISGHTGCVAIKSAADISPKDGCATGTEDNTCSIHYSEKVFEETVLTAGNASMPTYDGTSTMVGNTGNGYVKITYIEDTNDDTDHDTVFGIFNNPRKLIHDPLFYVALIAIVFSMIVLLSLNIVNETEKYKYAAIFIFATGVVELIYKLFF